jgi:photosystem II stability/assembly factor-like uncharacterized protein
MRRLLLTAALAVSLPLTVVAPADAGPGRHTGHQRHHHAKPLHWQERDTPSTESLRGLDAVDRRTAWVAGDGGGVWRTTDGGSTWADVAPAGTGNLLFRDVEAFSRRSAAILAIGVGDASRIYVTHDAGRSWRATFVNHDPKAFYDCMDFFKGGRRGLAMSDPVGGKFRILATRNGGRTWNVVPPGGMPAAVDGEAGFAASGTCIETAGRRDAWIASGGAASRIFHSRDGGRTWSVTTAPIPAAPAGGVFSLAFRDPRHGVAVGGDFTNEDNGVDASAFTRDGSRWVGGGDLGGYRSGVDWVHGRRGTLVAVGPDGSDITRNGGRTWKAFGDSGFHSVVCVHDRTCWASGTDGRVARLLHVR